jgi:hypothetical protein
VLFTDSTDPNIGIGYGGRLGLSYQWSCIRRVSLQPCFNATVNASFTAHQLPVVRLPAQYFAAAALNDSFALTLRVFKDGLQPSTSAPVMVSAYFEALPSLSLSLMVPTQGLNYVAINSNDQVVLAATLTPVSSTGPSYTTKWVNIRVDASGSANTPTPNLLNLEEGSPVLLSSPSSPLLVLKPGVLKGGFKYTFALILASMSLVSTSHLMRGLDTMSSPSSASSIASVAIAINGAPSGGTCTVSPAVGVTLQTKFVFACTGWSTVAANLPLTYAYRIIDPATDEVLVLLRKPWATSTFGATLPLGAPLTVKARDEAILVL